ncbi:MAG: hypothetical protein NC098_01825 [Lachnoclostridium sp.]|nr:hypothetical protein [Lachnoclostridium sp.]
MMKKLLSQVLITGLLMAIAASCSHSEPQEVEAEQPTNGGQNQGGSSGETPPPDTPNRPGITPDDVVESILADATPRYQSETTTYLADEPGVLICHDGNITTSYINIDNDHRIDFNYTGMRADSLLTGANLYVDGHAVTLVSAKYLKGSADVKWFRAAEVKSPGDTVTHVIVTPVW